MQCTQCFGSMQRIHNQTYYRCRDCGRYEFTTELSESFEPFFPTGESVDVCCPKCQCGLEFAMLHGRWRVCLCMNCRGYVIESGMLAVAVHEKRSNYRGEDALPTPINSEELEERRSCPACLQTMETHPYYGPGTAVINSCQGCKVTWMDYGELAAIIRAPGARPSPDSSPVVPRGAPVSRDHFADTLTETGLVMLRVLSSMG